MYHTILYDLTTVEGGAIATIRLNRPERKNSIGPEMANELLYALENAEKEDHVRVVVLTGTGGTFCAGGDMGAMGGGPVVSTLPMRGDYADLLLKMVRFTRRSSRASRARRWVAASASSRPRTSPSRLRPPCSRRPRSLAACGP